MKKPDFEHQPSLLIRLSEDVGKLPADIAIELPFELATKLLRHRKATPIASFGCLCDLALDASDLVNAGIDDYLNDLAAA